MYFNSIQYIFFLPLVVILFYLTPFRIRWLLLLATSYYFYMCWKPELIIIIIFSTLINYLTALMLDRDQEKKKKRFYLIASLVINLGMLIFFKYLGFLVEAIQDIFDYNVRDQVSPAMYFIAPIGISYYTLQSLGYILDVYYGKRKAEKHPGIFALYVAFFPIILSGPIERSTRLLPQLRNSAQIRLNSVNIEEGIKLIIWGYFLKLVIADRTGIYVDAVFGNLSRHGGITYAATIVLYSFQIYSDFAGYSSIAIGSARLMGFDILRNFNRPYFSATVGEFWTRWHISLSGWLRDYVFNPLAFMFVRLFESRTSFRTTFFTYSLTTFLTFFLCGFWHGARWTFLVWGCIHGIYLILEHLFRRNGKRRILNILLTYIMILFTWIFFRSLSMHDAFHIIKVIFTHPGSLYIPFDSDVVAPVYAVLGILILLLTEIKQEFFNNLFSFTSNKNEYVRMIAYGLVVFLILYLGVFDGSQFMYFKF